MSGPRGRQLDPLAPIGFKRGTWTPQPNTTPFARDDGILDFEESINSPGARVTTAAGAYCLIGTDAGLNSDAGFRSTTHRVNDTNNLAKLLIEGGMFDTTDIRAFFGFTGGATIATTMAADSPNLAIVGFQFSTSRGDTNWQLIHGSGGAPTVVNTGVAVADTTNPSQFLVEWLGSGAVLARIFNQSGAVVYSNRLTANIPAAASDLRVLVACRGLVAALKRIGMFGTSLSFAPRT
jgi:hypothetical protein